MLPQASERLLAGASRAWDTGKCGRICRRKTETQAAARGLTGETRWNDVRGLSVSDLVCWDSPGQGLGGLSRCRTGVLWIATGPSGRQQRKVVVLQ
jgi:hypothetical protein